MGPHLRCAGHSAPETPSPGQRSAGGASATGALRARWLPESVSRGVQATRRTGQKSAHGTGAAVIPRVRMVCGANTVAKAGMSSCLTRDYFCKGLHLVV